MSNVKIIVVGAGIAGLVAALALIQRGFSVAVYEKTTRIKNIGGGLLIYPHGLRVLKQLGLQDRLSLLHATLKDFIAYDHHGTLLLHNDFSLFYQQTSSSLLAVSRTDLQQQLLEAIPTHSLHLGHQCIKITEHTNRVSVTFENGVEDEADIVIGADGIHSFVRQSINKYIEPQYSGICFWGGILENHQRANVLEEALIFLYGINRTCWILPLNHGRQMWYIAKRMPEAEFIQQRDKISQLKSLCKNWSPYVDKILSHPQTIHNFALPVKEIKGMNRWHTERIALIGDAAHTFGPVQGQGTSAAIEDAYILAACIERYPRNSLHALLKYQTIRKPIVDKFQEIESMQQIEKITDDPKIIMKRNQKIASSSAAELLDPLARLTDLHSFQKQLEAI